MIRLRDIGIRKKLFLTFGVFLFFIMVIAVMGLVDMAATKRASRAVYEEAFSEAMKLLRLKSDLEDARRAMLLMISETDRARLTSDHEAVKEATRRVDAEIGEMLDEHAGFDKEAVRAVQEIRAVWEEFKKTRDGEIIPAVYEGDIRRGRTLVAGVQEERFKRFISIADTLVAHEEAEAAGSQDAIEGKMARGAFLYAAVCVLSVLIGVAMLMALSGDIGRRLGRITDAVNEMTRGRLDVKADAHGGDEVGDLARGFNEMAGRLNEDKAARMQYIKTLRLEKEKNERRAEELERLNKVFEASQREIEGKNAELRISNAELNATNRRLSDAKHQLVHSEKMASIGQLAAGIAHEINNPVGFINSNLSTLAAYGAGIRELLYMYRELEGAHRSGNPKDVWEVMGRIEAFKKDRDMDFAVEELVTMVNECRDGVDRVRVIIKGLKEFSHAGTGELQEFDVNHGLEGTVNMVWHEIKYSAAIRKDYGEVPHIRCRPQQINQVFMNLLMNAAQAIPEGKKGEIGLKTSFRDGFVTVEISDNGAGIPAKIGQKVFDPFFTTKPVGSGTGLGLSISYGIIKEHNGEIGFLSEAGRGTTFFVKLPVAAGGMPV
ncbi:MAG: MCP four helix bundle domain-containing protein [Deltaproteobacteria bacterium]|nr:MCP four helix bundle domain-containing protein [Deltaproteobacteria bacterium]